MSDISKASPLKRIVELLTPSALSSVVCIVASLTLALSVIFVSRFKSSGLRLQYQYYQVHHTISNSYLSGSILQNQTVKNLPLFVFWAIVGIVVYLISFDVIKTLRSTIELRKEMDYVNVHRRRLIRDVLTQLALRLIAVVIWLPYIIIFFHRIVLYAVKIAILTSSAGDVLGVIGYTVLSVAVGAIALHINVVLLRLVFLKPRLFSNILD